MIIGRAVQKYVRDCSTTLVNLNIMKMNICLFFVTLLFVFLRPENRVQEAIKIIKSTITMQNNLLDDDIRIAKFIGRYRQSLRR